MDFDFPTEQQELADALGRRLGTMSVNQTVWQAIRELGVSSLAVDENHGGFGGGAADLFLAFQCLGRKRAVSPLWGTAVAAKAIAWAGSPQLRRELLPAVASGELQLALAFGERALRHDLVPVGLTGALAGDGAQIRLSGEKTAVLFAEDAAWWLLSAQVSGRTRLLLVPRDTPAVHVQSYRTFDGLPAVDLRFDGALVAAILLEDDGNGDALLQRIADYGASLLSAEAVGLMECAKDTTLEYLKTRHQFGRALSEFQALQHRMVDVLIHLEQARSMALLAVAHADSEDVLQRTRNVAAAKALVGESARFVGQHCVQMHGAIGLTQECAVSGILKRLTAIDLTLGDTEHHLGRFAEIQLQALDA